MRYISVFSGIEAASVAWEGFGWEPLCFCEVDAFPSAVLAERFPSVPNLGDITQVDWKKYRNKADLVVGGSPCQSFSIAGKREGLQGASGLMFEYVRCVHEVRPRWFLWENVPGALSSGHGEDFRCLLESMDKLGYGMAWRVLDAQFFGVAQRRRRLFLVGRLGGEPPVEVLFEPDRMRWDYSPSGKERARLAAAAAGGATGASFAINGNVVGRKPENGGHGLGVSEEVAGTLTTADVPGVAPCTLKLRHTGSDNPGGGQGPLVQDNVGATLSTRQDQTLIIPINEMVATRGKALGRGTGFGVGQDGDPANTISASHPHAVGVLPQAFAQNSRDEVRPIGGGGSLAGALCAEQGAKQQTYVCLGDDNAKASIDEDMCGTLKCAGSAPIAAGFSYKAGAGAGSIGYEEGQSPTAMAGRHDLAVHSGAVVRRLTPVECERLQGFPDNFTRIPWRGKPAGECPDAPRYKAIGNSMAVPVMRWIGERIGMADAGEIR